jgi:hypothetical protein
MKLGLRRRCFLRLDAGPDAGPVHLVSGAKVACLGLVIELWRGLGLDAHGVRLVSVGVC